MRAPLNKILQPLAQRVGNNLAGKATAAAGVRLRTTWKEFGMCLLVPVYHSPLKDIFERELLFNLHFASRVCLMKWLGGWE